MLNLVKSHLPYTVLPFIGMWSFNNVWSFVVCSSLVPRLALVRSGVCGLLFWSGNIPSADWSFTGRGEGGGGVGCWSVWASLLVDHQTEPAARLTVRTWWFIDSSAITFRVSLESWDRTDASFFLALGPRKIQNPKSNPIQKSNPNPFPIDLMDRLDGAIQHRWHLIQHWFHGQCMQIRL